MKQETAPVVEVAMCSHPQVPRSFQCNIEKLRMGLGTRLCSPTLLQYC